MKKDILTKKNTLYYIKNFYTKQNIYFKLGLNNRKYNFVVKKRHSNELNKFNLNNEHINNKISDLQLFEYKIKNYTYYRNINGLPSRGQRTHTNARTKKKFKLKINS